jgi:hypothetical protein
MNDAVTETPSERPADDGGSNISQLRFWAETVVGAVVLTAGVNAVNGTSIAEVPITVLAVFLISFVAMYLVTDWYYG